MERRRLTAKARNIVDQTEDVRREKVAAFKEAVDKGTYRVNPRKLANALLAELLRQP